MTPTVIFKGQSFREGWFEVPEIPEWRFTASKKGWTDNELCLEWSENIFFLPQTAPIDPHEWKLIFCDGHSSHCSDKFQDIGLMNRVHVVYFPAHTSHILQPLDLVTFSILDLEHSSAMNQLCSLFDSRGICQIHLIQAYKKAHDNAFNYRHSKKAWEVAGIFPFNPEDVINCSLVQKKLQPNHLLREEVNLPITPPRLTRSAGVGSAERRKINDDYKDKIIQHQSQKIDKLKTELAMEKAAHKKTKAMVPGLNKPERNRNLRLSPNTKFKNRGKITHASERLAENDGSPYRKKKDKDLDIQPSPLLQPPSNE